MANEKMVFTGKQPQILQVLISPEVHESFTQNMIIAFTPAIGKKNQD